MNDKLLGNGGMTDTNPLAEQKSEYKIMIDDIWTKPVYYNKTQIWNSIDTEANYPWNKYNLMKPETTKVEKIEESPKKTESVVPKSVLELVPGSVDEDWHQHIHSPALVSSSDFVEYTVYKKGGWVYKNCTIHETAVIQLGCIVYDNAVIGEDSQIIDNSRIYGNARILGGIVCTDSKVFGNVLMQKIGINKPFITNQCEVSGDVQIIGHGIIRNNSNISGNVLLKNNAKIISSTVSGDIRLLDNTYIHSANVSGKVTLAGSANIISCTFVGNNFISISGSTQGQNDKNQVISAKYKTQKAKGMGVLSTFGLLDSTMYTIIDINSVAPYHLQKRFARPCPKTPRHGFVDSRYIENATEAAKMIEETKAADPESEIISMYKYTPDYSGVWTEGKISIGPGNDGATSGKDTVTIPVAGTFVAAEKFDIMKEIAGITESAYVELLWTKSLRQHNGNYNTVYDPVYVQLRDGPKLPVTIDFIPEQIVVKSVVLAEGNLLEWEQKAKSFEPGTVVYHPGGSLSSHYSVHCVINKIPVLISKKPKIGEKIRPSIDQNFVLDPEKVKQGFVFALDYDVSYMLATYAMLVGCHSISEWIGKEDFLLGFSLGCAFRLTVIAGIAEYRHYHRISSLELQRHEVYNKLWEKTAQFSTRHMFFEALKEFNTGCKKGSGGIGGPNWYAYCINAVNIINHLISNDISKAFEVWNTLINAVHNGGWGFNKFADGSVLDEAATSPVMVMMKVAPIFYQVKQHVRKMDESALQTLSKFYVNRRKWEITMSKSITQINTDICGCEEHECLMCYPNGCWCTKKDCHNCGVCNKCCDCKQCMCKKCNPAGCKCKNPFCHDCNQCAHCCGCKSHDCKKCYSWGCSCKSKKCHDCKKPECIFCLFKSKITEVQVKIVGKTALIHYKRQGKLGYETVKKEIIASNLEIAKKWVLDHSTSSSWAGSTTVMYAPCVWSGSAWMLGPYVLDLPASLGSCGCDEHTCNICYPKGKCPCINKYCHDCKNHNCSGCFPAGCNCKCTDCHKTPCKCDKCNCGDHNCGICYPEGCNCSCSDCHDDGCDECIEPETEAY